MTDPKPTSPSPPPAEPKPWRRAVVIGVLSLVVLAVGVRWVTADATPPPPDPAKAQQVFKQGPGLQTLKPDANLQVPKDAEEAKELISDWTDTLPFVTEGGLALLLGIGLGLASRAAAKLIAIMALLFFMGLQYFAYQGVVSVDYAALMDWVRRFVLNVGGGDAVADFTRKLPALGSLGVGYLIGLKR
ncbi:MAG: FUN14 domain-containing protein [Myxococcales bacterium]|nr:FUN14 domain-containing protein [Myxococcales bacterium]MCB9524197.1 FUN14 domain-containing protein [Myxococcales bacterium]